MTFQPDASLFSNLTGKTVIVTGGANGIGLETALQYYAHGTNIVVADLASTKPVANEVINQLGDVSRALFVAVDITIWGEVRDLFAQAFKAFGAVDIVVANAGIMESRRFFDFSVDGNGDLQDDGFGRVIDVNLKGTMNSVCDLLFLPFFPNEGMYKLK